MNRLEDELTSLNFSISILNQYLKGKKDIRYEDWCAAHKCIDELTARRSKLLHEVMGKEL